MPTTTYKVAPASPILASSLLSTESGLPPDRKRPDADPNQTSKWDLRFDIEKGLLPSRSASSSNEHDIFRPGAVIGFSSLRGRSLDGNEDEFVGELPRHLLTTWLRRTLPPLLGQTSSQPQPQPHSRTRTYIIHPQHSTIFSPAKLLSSLVSRSGPTSYAPPLSRNAAITLLDAVQLFPVFDFAGAVDAISDVGERLHKIWNDRQQNQNQNENENEKEDKSQQTVVVIVGLDTLTEAVIRSSNAVRGTAVLTSALRTITQLSRMHRDYLSVLLVNTSGIGPSPSMHQHLNQNQSQSQAQREYETRYTRDDGIGIQSMFYAHVPLFLSLLMKTLDQGVDTHLLMSISDLSMDAHRRVAVPVVEVIKDRVGGGLGRWCVWNGKDSQQLEILY
ncbi:hypothetical protein BDV10DRAFT_182659 [Aspergillus recurvatus]